MGESVTEILEKLESNSINFIRINRIEPGEVASIAKLLYTNQSLHILDLSATRISNEAIREILKALCINKSVCKLYLDFNGIKEIDTTIEIANVLKMNTTIQVLSLNDNCINKSGIVKISKGLKKNSTLKKLFLFGNELEGFEICQLAQSLINNTSLQVLNLDDNKIEDYDIEYIKLLLEKNSTLHTLSLNNNLIGMVGTIYIAQALEVNKSLTALYLNDNMIGSYGAISLAKSLIVNKSLHELYINNHLDDDAVIEFANVLKINKSLRTLSLEDCFIKIGGVTEISNMLQINKTLQKLYLDVSNKEMLLIIKALYYNTSLQVLQLGKYGTKEYVIAEIINCLKTNYTLTKIITGTPSADVDKLLYRNKQLQNDRRFKKTKSASKNYHK